MQHNNGGIYIIYDNVAKAIQGQLVVFRHAAAAVRFFADIASAPDNIISAHIDDYDLIQLGYLTDDNELVPEKEIIITGKAWAASRAPRDNTINLTK